MNNVLRAFLALFLALSVVAPAQAVPTSKMINNVRITGNLTVDGTTTSTGNVTNTGNFTVGGNLAVTGTSAHTGAATFTGAVTHSSTLLQTGVATFTLAPVLTTGTLTVGGTTVTVPAATSTLLNLGSAQAITGVKTFADSTCVQTEGTGTATYNPSGRLSEQTTQIATGANTTETDGHTYTLPANTLSANGKAVRVRIWGTTAANGNTKTLQLYFGGTSIYTTGAVAANAKNYFIEELIVRTGVGAQKIYINGHFNGATITASNIVTAAKDETTALVIKDTITNGSSSAGDITEEGFSVDALP